MAAVFQSDVFQVNVFQTADIGNCVFQADVFQNNVFQVCIVAPPIIGGIVGFPSPRPRPRPIVGAGFGILPELEAEGFGVVVAIANGQAEFRQISALAIGAIGTSGQSAGKLLPIRGNAIADHGQVGTATAILKEFSIASRGTQITSGFGLGRIMMFEANATGIFYDAEVAAMMLLLAA